MIQLDDIHLSYGRAQVLQGFSLEVKPGQVTLLVGANGAGKSTAMKVAAGLLRPKSGRVRIVGPDPAGCRRDPRRCVSYLPQSVAFHPRLRAADVLRFYASVHGAGEDRVLSEARRWGLEPHLSKGCAQLSGGLRQRLGLAVLMLPQAPVLLLDEPGISLDPEWRARMQDVLLLEAALGRSVLVATHLLGEWEGRAHRCLLCHDGRVTAHLDPDRLRCEALEPTLRQEAI